VIVVVSIKKLSEVKAKSCNIIGFEGLGSFLDFFWKLSELEKKLFFFFSIEESVIYVSIFCFSLCKGGTLFEN
jgi:hypothetical protein